MNNKGLKKIYICSLIISMVFLTVYSIKAFSESYTYVEHISFEDGRTTGWTSNNVGLQADNYHEIYPDNKVLRISPLVGGDQYAEYIFNSSVDTVSVIIEFDLYFGGREGYELYGKFVPQIQRGGSLINVAVITAEMLFEDLSVFPQGVVNEAYNWYHYKFVLDLEKQQGNLFISTLQQPNVIIAAYYIPLKTSQIDRLRFYPRQSSTSGPMYLDNLVVYTNTNQKIAPLKIINTYPRWHDLEAGSRLSYVSVKTNRKFSEYSKLVGAIYNTEKKLVKSYITNIPNSNEEDMILNISTSDFEPLPFDFQQEWLIKWFAWDNLNNISPVSRPLRKDRNNLLITVNQDGTGDYTSINDAAQLAQAGDTILVYQGTYREHVKPKWSGFDEETRITYKAVGEVIIKGSDIASGWVNQGGNVWSKSYKSEYFGIYNPYAITMAVGKLPDGSRNRTLGMVYFNGIDLNEVNLPSDVYNESMTWSPSADGLTIYANFGGSNPNENIVEINVREQVFAPLVWNQGYITVDGFKIMHAANNYDDSLGLQTSKKPRGAISTFGGHNWIIENCEISYSTIGMDIGLGELDKYGGIPQFNGYNIIRNNTIKNTGATGIIIINSIFSEITGNSFSNTNRLNVGGGAKGSIKANKENIDLLIKDNRFYNDTNSNTFSIWLDTGNQGVRITGNVFANSAKIKFEASHGPVQFDNNILLNTLIQYREHGGILFAHNIFYNTTWYVAPDTPKNVWIYAPHSTEKVYQENAFIRQNRFFNNIIIGQGIVFPVDYPSTIFDNSANYNILLEGAEKFKGFNSTTNTVLEYDVDSIKSQHITQLEFTADDSNIVLEFNMDSSPFTLQSPYLSNEYLGMLSYVGQGYCTINKDYFQNDISNVDVIAGPFSDIKQGYNSINIWPK